MLRLQFHDRPFSWPFFLADVDFPIVGVNFLKQHCLMVDPTKNRLVDAQGASLLTLARASPPTASVVTGLHQQHGLSSTAPLSPASSSSSSSSPTVAAGRYRDLLAEFPDVVNASKRLPAVSHDVVHHIVTTGPPIAAKFHRLDGEKLAAAKAEFKQLQEDGIIQRSLSPWSSPLHIRVQ